MCNNHHYREISYGFPTVFGRGLYDEFKNFVNPPFLIVTMQDLWAMFSHHFEAADYEVYFTDTLEQDALDKIAHGYKHINSIIGLGGGQALDVAKYFSWRNRTPLFQAPTALSVNAVYGQRAGVRKNGAVIYRGWAVPETVYIDYDVLAHAPPHLNWSGIGDILCFHTGVLDWKYAQDIGRVEEKWQFDHGLANQSLTKAEEVIRHIDDIRNMTDTGIQTLVDGLKWGTSFHGAGWCPRHIEGTDHFLFYTLEKLTGKKFLHGQPVGLGVVIGSMLHENRADEMLDTISAIGLDIRPEAMRITWKQFVEGLTTMKSYVNRLPLWHSLAHDADITPGFISDVKGKLDKAYKHLS